MKFGRTDNLDRRIDNMRNGWLQPDGRRGPALALADDWSYVVYRIDRFDSESALLDIALKDCGIAAGRRLARRMRRAALAGLAGETNGVGELRILPSDFHDSLERLRFRQVFDPVVTDILFEAGAFVRSLEIIRSCAV